MARLKLLSVAGLILGSALHPGAAHAAEEPGSSFRSVHMDQDLFAFGHNEDRNYTMGVRFVWQGEAAERKLAGRLMFSLLNRIDSGFDPDGVGAYALTFGNSAFTPDDLRRSDVIDEDRPYGSLLYVGSSVVVPRDQDHAVGAKLVVGALGLPISDWGQSAIHWAWRHAADTEQPYDPKGWHNQISEGGELTAMYQRSWLRRVPVSSASFDAAQSFDLYAGYYTGASYALVGKWGRFDKEATPFWEMVGDIDPQADANMLRRLALGASAAGEPQSDATPKSLNLPGPEPWYRIKEWYFTAGARVRWVGYNELLQGGFRDSAHTLSSGELERWLAEASVGLNLTFPRGRRLMLTCTERSPEHQLAERRSHRWCGINFYRAAW